MTSNPFQHSDPGQLARLLHLGGDAAELWPDEDAGALLRHQLAAPLLPDLTHDPDIDLGRVERLVDESGVASFEDLLNVERVEGELLSLARHYFREANLSCHALPPDVARVMRTALASVSLLRGDGESEAALGDEVRWVLARPWVDDPVRRVCRAARDVLSENAR